MLYTAPVSGRASAVIAIGVIGIGIGMFFFYGAFFGSAQEEEVRVVVPEGATGEDVGAQLASAFDWNDEEIGWFSATLTSMQWMAFKEPLSVIGTEEFQWEDEEREIFLTHDLDLLRYAPDLFSETIMPGEYVFSSEDPPEDVAAGFVARVTETHEDVEAYLETRISDEQVERIGEFVRREMELLPDLVSLAPQDLSIRREGNRTLLVFSTTYYNVGESDLELVADPATAGIAEDVERTVFQRIPHRDGTVRDHPVGIFEWHQEHLHYHFSDFVDYELTAVDAPGLSNEGLATSQKATFCIRDVTRFSMNKDVNDADPSRESRSEARFRICGKERQGVTVGWGDTYFSSYPDQNLDMTDLPSGTYRLRYFVNPEKRLEEMTLENNASSAVFDYDAEEGSITVLEEHPEEYPAFEHVHVEQDLQ